MRTIKFRAWNRSEGKMYCPNYFHFSPEGDLYGILVNEGRLLPASDFDLMMFTGRKDKNGRDIYEGDLLQFDTGIYEVVYSEYSTCFALKNTEPDFLSSYSDDMLEVVGNIHEHHKEVQRTVPHEIIERKRTKWSRWIEYSNLTNH